MMGESYRNIFGYSRDFTVKGYLEYAAAWKDVPVRETTKKINYLLDILTLSDVKRKKIAKLSGGMNLEQKEYPTAGQFAADEYAKLKQPFYLFPGMSRDAFDYTTLYILVLSIL